LDVKGYDPSNPNIVEKDQSVISIAAEDFVEYATIPSIEKAISKVKKQMEKSAKDLDFMEAAKLRDYMFELQKKLDTMKAK
jgi:excinuclease ABC subunit B